MTRENPNWQEKIKRYCELFNLPLNYLAETLNQPKVVPMVRGISFEFTVYKILSQQLDNDIWDVIKPTLNAQLGIPDIDVLIIHKNTKKQIRVECKLAKKGSCVVRKNNTTEIQVKCMRSRTIGTKIAQQLSTKYNRTAQELLIHSDQYLPRDFDFVVTSIGNAFYTTAGDSFVFRPNDKQKNFLKNFPGQNLQNESFFAIYITKSNQIAVKAENNVVCTRRACSNKTDCGFIPNYPRIYFNTDSLVPLNNWYPLSKAHDLFIDFCNT